MITFVVGEATGVVAFLAKIAGFAGSPSEHTTIPFDVVDLNIGNSYDPATGVFTPPVSGVYDVSYEVLAAGACGTENICVQLEVNGAIIHMSCSEVYSSGGASVVVQLSAGDAVTVAVNHDTQCQVLHSSSSYNKFSCHLIYKII